MSRRNRPSSLPSSLIPYLYTGPQRDSSTRTTLPDDDDSPLNLRPLEDFHSHSPPPSEPFYYAPQHFHLYDQPYSRHSEPGPSTRREIYFPEPERHELPHRPYHAQDVGSYAQAGLYSYRDRLPVDPYALIRRSEPRPEYPSRSERPEYPLPPLAPLAPRPEAGPSSNSDGPAGPSSTPHSAGTDDNDSEYTPSQPSRKRKLSTDSTAQPPPKRLKKTLIACDFCRGRKLRCDGNQPSCMNCITRDHRPCVYRPYPKRRGPGRAPKGSKKNSPGTTRSSSNTSQKPTTEYSQLPPPPDPSRIVFKQDQDVKFVPRPHIKRSLSDES